MAKTATPPPAIKESSAVPDTAAANQLAVARLEQNERVTSLARQLNYQGDLSQSALRDGARGARDRLGMSVLEFGAYLLLLKESCGHGQFGPELAKLEVGFPAASRYMAMARRFSNVAKSQGLEKLGFSKMAELLVLDDEQANELIEQGQTGELALDDVSTMSVKQLRAAVRKERAEAAKQLRRAERQEAVNAELHEEVRLIKSKPVAEQVKRLVAEAATVQAETLGMVQGALRAALTQLQGCEQDQSLLMAGMVGQLIAELVGLRDEFNLPEVGATPEWETWAEANPGQAAKG